jgi:hypothetical protein
VWALSLPAERKSKADRSDRAGISSVPASVDAFPEAAAAASMPDRDADLSVADALARATYLSSDAQMDTLGRCVQALAAPVPVVRSSTICYS